MSIIFDLFRNRNPEAFNSYKQISFHFDETEVLAELD
jgi:hypothetical protein